MNVTATTKHVKYKYPTICKIIFSLSADPFMHLKKKKLHPKAKILSEWTGQSFISHH